MNNINVGPFFRQLAERVARALRRDMLELESLQNKGEGAIKYAKTSFEKLSNLLVDECLNFDRTFGIYVKDISSIRGLKKVENPKLNWHINPISNIYNFAHTNNNFAVSVALTDSRKDVIASMIYLPALDTLYYAEKRKGCFKVDHTGKIIKIAVGTRALRDVIITALSRSCLSKFESAVDVRQSRVEITGCMLVDSVNLANGKIDLLFANSELKISCYAAQLIITEARGTFGIIELESADHLDVVAGNMGLVKSLGL